MDLLGTFLNVNLTCCREPYLSDGFTSVVAYLIPHIDIAFAKISLELTTTTELTRTPDQAGHTTRLSTPILTPPLATRQDEAEHLLSRQRVAEIDRNRR